MFFEFIMKNILTATQTQLIKNFENSEMRVMQLLELFNSLKLSNIVIQNENFKKEKCYSYYKSSTISKVNT